MRAMTPSVMKNCPIKRNPKKIGRKTIKKAKKTVNKKTNPIASHTLYKFKKVTKVYLNDNGGVCDSQRSERKELDRIHRILSEEEKMDEREKPREEKEEEEEETIENEEAIFIMAITNDEDFLEIVEVEKENEQEKEMVESIAMDESSDVVQEPIQHVNESIPKDNQAAVINDSQHDIIELDDEDDDTVYFDSLPSSDHSPWIIHQINIIRQGQNVLNLFREGLFPDLSPQCDDLIAKVSSCQEINAKIRRGIDLNLQSLKSLAPRNLVQGDCLSLDTTFYTRLLEGGRNKDNCMEVLGKIDFLKTRLIFVPIHWNHPDFKHWSVVVIKIPTFDITFIDSLDLHETIPLRKDYLNKIKEFIEEYQPLTKEKWNCQLINSTQQPAGSVDCGVHVLLNCLCLAKGAPLDYPIEAVLHMRHRAVIQLAKDDFAAF